MTARSIPAIPDRLDDFEQRVLFKITRAAPTILAMAAIVGIAAALFLFLRGSLPVGTKVVSPEAKPPIVIVNRQDVINAIRKDSLSAVVTPADAAPAAAPTRELTIPPSADAVAIAKQLGSLKRLFTSRGLMWEEDLGPFIISVLERYDTERSREQVELPSGEAFLVNVSNPTPKISALNELLSIVSARPGNEFRLTAYWDRLRRQREQDREKTIQEASARYAAATGAAEVDHALGVGAQSGRRLLAKTIAGVSIAALLAAGLTLAFLAIERNTRALTAIAIAVDRSGGAAP